jgi:hypothetical protein
MRISVKMVALLWIGMGVTVLTSSTPENIFSIRNAVIVLLLIVGGIGLYISKNLVWWLLFILSFTEMLYAIMHFPEVTWRVGFLSQYVSQLIISSACLFILFRNPPSRWQLNEKDKDHIG